MKKTSRQGWSELAASRVGWAIPVVRQEKTGECGPASLAMILGFYGVTTGGTELAYEMERKPDGYSAKSLLDRARLLGLTAAAVRVRPADVPHLPVPCIMYLKYKHFVVFAGVSKSGVCLLDPGFGRYTASWEQFGGLFSGLALTFTANGKTRPRIRRSRVRRGRGSSNLQLRIARSESSKESKRD